MASVKEIQQNLQQTFDGAAFISASQAQRYLGVGKDKRAAMLQKIPVIKTGKQKRYFCGDIARLLASSQTFEPYGAG